MGESIKLPEKYLEVSIQGQTQVFPIGNGGICRIGRAAHNTIVLDSSQVSRDHALVDCPDDRDCVFTDLGSINGAYINGVRVAAPEVLKDGDLITIGEFRLVFRQPARGDEEERDSMIKTTVRLVNEEITVMVIDIRGYTPLSLKVGAERLGKMLGHFFRESGPLLRAQGAWSQKYIGDAVMAIWMHDGAEPGSRVVHKALRSVYGLHEIANSLQGLFHLDEPVRIGAGLNTGFASIGNLGSAAGADHTALGDTVNKAFRLESATKEAGCDILIGNSTLAHLAKEPACSHFQARQVSLKGYAQPETCHGLSFAALATLLGAEKGKANTVPAAAPVVSSGENAADVDFGPRYRVERLLGQGGMGAVYLAYDKDLGRQVALKLVRSEYLVQPEALARFRQELLLASKISHRNVLRLHDLSQTGDTKFISMAYVDGEDLHRLLVREGKLPLGRMLNIARQLCSALEAAHAEGVVHRDLKPQNILLAKDDHVFVSDFGLAKPLDQVSNVTQAGQMLGTPRYMAPEQVEAREVDARTDIYALGLLFYEMLTGDIPYSTESTMQFMYKRARETPPAPKTVVADIPDWLNGVVMKCLERDPAGRYQTATEILADIDAQQKPAKPTPVSSASPSVLMPVDGQAGTSGQPTRRSWKSRIAGAAAIVVLVGAVIAGGFAWRAHEKSKLTDKDTIVLADFANKTGEAVFDEALKQGLAVQLEQSPFLSILTDTRVRQTLRLMNKPADEPITRDIAREVCLRQGAKAFITGSIAPLGSAYVIGVDAVNSQTGDFIAREQAQSARKEEVLKTLSDLSSALRRRLGESLSSIQKFDAPLLVTTSSLEALKAFAMGAEASRRGKYTEAIPRLKTAIELDPNFALAYQSLSAAHRNTRQIQLARNYAEKAFALRDRVTELERLRIAISYYRNVTVELDRAREIVEQLQGSYPRDAQASANMANLCILLGQPEKAVKAAQEAIRMGSTGAATRANLSLGLVRLNRFKEAKEVAERASREGLDSYLLRAMRFQIAYLNRDEAAIKRLFDETEQKSGPQFSLEMQVEAAAFEGRLRQSQELGRRLADMVESGGNAELALLYRSSASRYAALLGDCTPVRSLHPPANVVDLDDEVIENVATGLALCDGGGAEMIAVNALKAYPKSTLMNGQTVPIIRAASALQHGNGQAAIEALEPARRYDAASAFRTQYLRGLAYLNLKSSTVAMAEFQSILDHRGREPLSPLYPLAHLGLARAAVMAGDTAKARKVYQEFLTLWKDADADLALLRAARQEYERIRNQ